MNKKSWVILEVFEDKEIVRCLAGTEDKVAVIRMLSALKKYQDECIKAGKHSETIIRSTLEDEAENPNVAEILEDNQDVDRLLSMVGNGKSN